MPPTDRRDHLEMSRPENERSTPGELVDRARPILFEKTREGAVSEQPPIGLAARTIVRLVVGVSNALHGRTTDRAWLTELAVYGHLFAEGSDFGWKLALRFLAQPVRPLDERFTRGFEETFYLLPGQARRVLDW